MVAWNLLVEPHAKKVRNEVKKGVDAFAPRHIRSRKPDVAWKWRKWTFGFWTDPENWTAFGIDIGPLEIVWRYEGYRQ